MNRILLIAVIVTLGVGSLIGQESTAVAPDKSLRSNARINPSTLAMEMEIPLARYAGRGISVPVSISYSSKLWRMEESGTFPIINSPECWKLGRPRFSELSAAGWTASTAVPYIEYVGFDNLYTEIGFPIYDGDGVCDQSTYNSINYVRRIVVHMPGGGTHELRADDTVISYPTNAPASNPYRVDNQANWDTTFYAVDGSNLIYVEDSAAGTYRLKLTDGSQIDFISSRETVQWANSLRTVRKASTMKDVNGNKIVYGSGSQTDTIGRTIPSPFGLASPTAPTVQTYNLPGFGTEGTVSYKLHWKKLKDTTAAESALTNFGDTLCYAGGNVPYPGNPQPPAGSCMLFNGKGFGKVVADPIVEFNPVLLRSLELPDGRTYEFGYDVHGRINKITYPTGAYETFVYSAIPTLNGHTDTNNDIYSQVNHGVTSRSVYESVGATPATWTYSAERGPSYGYKVRTVAPDGTKSERYLIQGNQIFTQPGNGTFGFDTPLAGMAYEERSYTSGPDNLIAKTITTWGLTQLSVSGPYTPATADWHPRATRVESIVYDVTTGGALSSSVATDFDGNLSLPTTSLNPRTVKQYGYTANIGSLGTLEKQIETDYLADSNYSARNLRSLPSEVLVKDGGGAVKTKMQFTYDGETLLDESESTRWDNPGTAYRGLLTKTRSWHDITNNLYIDTRARYDLMGNLRYSWDGRNNFSQVEYSSAYDYAYPTKTISPIPDSNGTYGHNDEFETTTVYDYNTGLSTSTTDANGQTTSMSYADPVTSVIDPLLRIRKVTAPNGHKTITEYGAGTSANTRWVKTKMQIDETRWKESLKWFDGLSRTVRTQSVDDDGHVSALTCYDAAGRVLKATNPFRIYSTQDCSTTTGLEWTTNTYDSAGRPWKMTTPDGAIVETTYGIATGGSQIGTLVTVEDQADKQKRSITNALGQLIRMDEPDTSSITGNLGSISNPNQPTLYTYDTLGNLTGVQQDGDTSAECGGASSCAQTRSFTYDSLSRLSSVTNPESGTINYTYDDNGNLAVKVDARNITTTFNYDRLNRINLRAYTNEPSGSETPDVSYFYDNLTNAKGKLIKVSSSVSTSEYTSFDVLGRVTSSKQTTDGVTYGNGATDSLITYSYNLAGALIEQQYPSGRKVQNVFDQTGDLEMVSSRKNTNSGYWAYANNFNYNAAGAVASMQLGNGTWESTAFNSRLQPEQIALGTVQSGHDKLKLNYTYGTTANNGNVLSQTITVSGTAGFTVVQNYTYDSLNRIQEAEETPYGWTATNCASDPTKCWKQTFTYDRYGNRNFDTAAGKTTTLGSCATAMCNPSISTTNNRINAVGYSFDVGGNTTSNAEGRTFTYDAENKQIEVKNASSATLGQYWYDGDGRRVKKYVPITGEVTIFVYDAAGKLVAEYSTIIVPTDNAKVAYLTNDHLGSPRINTDKNSNVAARHDYRPFGEEIVTGQRTSDLGYSEDLIVRKQFTGYERDGETELDYAINRYHSPQLGRFTQVDPYNIILEKEKGKDGKEKQQIFLNYVAKPQIWNRYIYCVNNPMNLTDPDGRRPLNDEDRRRLRILLDEYNKAVGEGEAGKEKAYAIAKAMQTMMNEIAAIPEGQNDPARLRAFFVAVDYLGDARFAKNGSEMKITSKGITVKVGANDYKCNFFIATVYVKAGVGFKTDANPGGFDTSRQWTNVIDGMPPDLPSANAMGDDALTNFGHPNEGGKIGDIIVAPYEAGSGHAGIALHGTWVISASDKHGVRIGDMGNSGSPSSLKYRSYKY